MSVEIYSKKENKFVKDRLKTFYKIDLSINPPFPKNALVELSNWCNHSCVFCSNPRMVRDKGFIDINIYTKFVKEAVALGLKELGLYTTGEPFFIKDLANFVNIAKSEGVEYVYITSNGALAVIEKVIPLIEAGLSSLKFSVNAGTRETYNLIHGKDDFDKVLQNIKNISEYRNNNNINLNLLGSCVITKYTQDEKEKIIELLGSYLDEIVFVGVEGQGGQSLDQLSLLESSMTDKVPDLGEASPCSMLWNRVHLTREGFFTLCCIDYENSLTYADINSMSVEDAWNNQVIVEMRQKHIEQKLQGTLCFNCLYQKKEDYKPITKLGRNSQSGFISNNPKGIQDISKRIEKLENLKNQNTPGM
jgi:pyruvate-formate lyase-activating enzyme